MKFSLPPFHVVLTAVLLTCFAPTSLQAKPGSDSITQSIVKIIATHNHPDYSSPWQRYGIHTVTGSGVIIDQQRILTNAHVVADQTLLEVQREGSGNTYTGWSAETAVPGKCIRLPNRRGNDFHHRRYCIPYRSRLLRPFIRSLFVSPSRCRDQSW